MTLQVPRLPFALDPLIAEAKRRARQRRLLFSLAAILLVAAALGAVLAERSSNGSAGSGAGITSGQISKPLQVGASDCGSGVSGRDFRVWACMSGGASAGDPHPKELLVVRRDGSSAAFPAFRGGEFAVGDGEIVATYNTNLVRVTSNRLFPILTGRELARALHIRATAIADIHTPKVNGRGDIYFVASILGHVGCENTVLERTAGGVIREIQALRNTTCS